MFSCSKAKWSQSKECTMQVVISSSQDCMSFGDALREIDREVGNCFEVIFWRCISSSKVHNLCTVILSS